MSDVRDAWVGRVLGIQRSPQPDKAALKTRLMAAMGRVAEAIRAAPDRETELTRLAKRAADMLNAGNPTEAPAAIVTLELALSKPTPAAPASLVNYAKSRLAWADAKRKLHADVTALRDTVLIRYRDAPAFPEIQAKIGVFDRVLDSFDEDLGDLLDLALNAADPAERRKHHAAAAKLIGTFLTQAETDPMIAKLEANPFLPFQARAVLLRTLGDLSRQIT